MRMLLGRLGFEDAVPRPNEDRLGRQTAAVGTDGQMQPVIRPQADL